MAQAEDGAGRADGAGLADPGRAAGALPDAGRPDGHSVLARARQEECEGDQGQEAEQFDLTPAPVPGPKPKPERKPRAPKFDPAVYDPSGAERLPNGYADWAWINLLAPLWDGLREGNGTCRLGPCGNASPKAKGELGVLLRERGIPGLHALIDAIRGNEWLMGRKGHHDGTPFSAGWVFGTNDDRAGKIRWRAMLERGGWTRQAPGAAPACRPFYVGKLDFTALDDERRGIIDKNRQAMGEAKLIDFARDLLDDQREMEQGNG